MSLGTEDGLASRGREARPYPAMAGRLAIALPLLIPKGLVMTAVMDAQTAIGELDFTDDELTALALAADPDQPLSPDAVPLALYPQPFGPLPLWYMPPVMASATRSWRMPVVLMIVAAFLLIDAFGLCITYGQLTAA